MTSQLITADELRSRVKNRFIRERILGKLGLTPFPQQRAVLTALDNGAKNLAINKGTRGGGTVISIVPILAQLAFSPERQWAERTVPVFAPYSELADRAFKLCYKAVFRDNVMSALPGFANFNPRKMCKVSERERYISFPWNSRIITGTADNPDSMLGEGYPHALCDEFARWKELIYEEYIERAMLDSGGVSMLVTTPRGNNHWARRYQDWTEQAKTDPRYFTTTWTSYDNPHNDRETLDRIKAEYLRRGLMNLFRMNFLAEFTVLQGAIYDMFRSHNAGEPWHVQDIEYDPDLPLVLSIDWGENFRVLFGQVIDGDRLFIVDELVIVENDPNKQLREVIAKLDYYCKLAGKDDYSDIVEMSYCDPSGKGMKTLFENAGIPVFWTSPEERRSINDVGDGIVTVQVKLSNPDRPDIVIARRCHDLIERIPAYERNSKTEKPVKENDHSVDALRYLTVGVFGLYTAAPDILFF